MADFSRARTLAEGLGLLKKGKGVRSALGQPASGACQNWSERPLLLARRKAVLLVGDHHPRCSSCFRYRRLPKSMPLFTVIAKSWKSGEDVLATSNSDGMLLYRTLIAPAAPLFAKGARVVVIPDGSLNSLNFETLLVPGNTAPHYWIEDAVLTNAHSLRLLSLAKAILRQNVENAADRRSACTRSRISRVAERKAGNAGYRKTFCPCRSHRLYAVLRHPARLPRQQA